MNKLLLFLPMFILALAFVSANSLTLLSGTDAEYNDDSSWNSAVALTSLDSSWMNYADIPGAVWIWTGKGVTYDNSSNVLFRHKFDLSRCSENPFGVITITSDNAFTLKVNGDNIVTDPDWISVATYDISSSLRPGSNTIFINAVNGNPETNPAGIVYRVDITYDSYSCGGRVTLNSEVLDSEVPEFGVIAGAVALVGALGIFLYRRK